MKLTLSNIFKRLWANYTHTCPDCNKKIKWDDVDIGYYCEQCGTEYQCW